MKKILALLMVLTMSFSLAACGQKDQVKSDISDNPVDEVVDSGEPITIRFANYAVLEEAHTVFWEEMKAGFEAENENITIEYVTAPFGEIVQQVLNMAGAGERVDAIYGEIDWMAGLVESGLISPVTDILSEEYLADFYPNVLEAHKVNDEVYSVPLYVGPFVLYYNKDLFEKAGLDANKPPTTYDEMLVMAEKLSKLTTEDGNKVYAFGQTTASVPISGTSITSMIYNFGGDVLDENGALNVDNQGFKDAITMLKTLDEKGYNPQNAKLKDLRNLFALGQLAMYYDQTWGFAGIGAINPEAKDFTATAKPLIGGSGNGESLLQSHNIMLVDNGDAKNAATSKFVEYIINDKNLGERMANITLAYPPKKEMENSEHVSTILEGATGSVDKIKPQVFISESNNLNLELCTLAQDVTLAKQDVDTSIEKFKEAAKAIID